jgi:hypothetical protein
VNPYREPSPRLQHWDDPQPGDLARVMGGCGLVDVLAVEQGSALCFFDFYSDAVDVEDLVVVERRSELRQGKE